PIEARARGFGGSPSELDGTLVRRIPGHGPPGGVEQGVEHHGGEAPHDRAVDVERGSAERAAGTGQGRGEAGRRVEELRDGDAEHLDGLRVVDGDDARRRLPPGEDGRDEVVARGEGDHGERGEHLDSRGIEAGLLLGLAQRRGDRVGIGRFGAPAGEGDLARMRGEGRGATLQQDVEVARDGRIDGRCGDAVEDAEEDEHRGVVGAARIRERRDRHAPGVVGGGGEQLGAGALGMHAHAIELMTGAAAADLGWGDGQEDRHRRRTRGARCRARRGGRGDEADAAGARHRGALPAAVARREGAGQQRRGARPAVRSRAGDPGAAAHPWDSAERGGDGRRHLDRGRDRHGGMGGRRDGGAHPRLGHACGSHRSPPAAPLAAGHDERHPGMRVREHIDGLPVDLLDPCGREDLGRRAGGGDPTAREQSDAVGVRERGVEVVQHDRDRDPGLRPPANHPHDVFVMLEVQGRRRLVEQQDPGVLGEHAGQRHPRALTAGEGGDGALPQRRDLGRRHRCRHGAVVLLGGRAPPPRRASHPHDLLDREGEGDGVLLQQHGALPGEVAGTDTRDRTAVEEDGAGHRSDVPREHAEQGGLARAVRPDEGVHLAGVDGDGRVVEDGASVPDAHREPLAPQARAHAHPPDRRRVRTRSQRKNGPPTRDVIMPMGRSASGTAVRATRSAAAMRSAPPRAEAITSGRCAGPISMRMRWGTTRPANPMIPAKATAAQTSSATVTITTIRSSSTGTPRCRAVRSPRAKRSRLGATIRATTIPIATSGATSWMFDQRAPFSEPSCQNTICSRVEVVPRNVRKAMPAPAMALIAMPVSSSVTTSVRPPERLRR
ncbi:unnamed protein product, partial [Penicillium discolor]